MKKSEGQSFDSSLVEQLPVGIAGFDLDLKLSHGNASFFKMFGYQGFLEFVRENPFLDKKRFAQKKEFDAFQEKVKELAINQQLKFEAEFIREQNKKIRASIILQPQVGKKNKVTGYNGVFIDITQAKKTGEQQENNRRIEAIGTLAGGVSHDFNNLLMVISLCTESLLNKMKGDTENPFRHNVEEIKKASERAANLTRQLLVFSRRHAVKPKIIDLNELILGIEKLTDRLIGNRLTIKKALYTDLHEIKADSSQIEQLLMNLLMNAQEASEEGAEVVVRTENVEIEWGEERDKKEGKKEALQEGEYLGQSLEVGEYVLLVVKDEGKGMDEETLKHAFDPFFTTKEENRGLGLSTSYGIVTQCKGSIQVKSQVGEGTEFQIYFPIEGESAKKKKGKFSEKNLKEKLKRESNLSSTILLVEDDSQVGSVLAQVLETRGFQLLHASSGKEAITKSNQYKGKIGLLLTDVGMPGMNGPELGKILKQKRPDLEIIYLSGYVGDRLEDKGALDTGALVLQKPLNINELCEIFESYGVRPREVEV